MIEEPIFHDNVYHYFMTSLSSFDQFGTNVCLQCSGLHENGFGDKWCLSFRPPTVWIGHDHIGWNVRIGPINHHLGKCCVECDQLLLVAPRWEGVMADINNSYASADDVYEIGRLVGYRWKLEDVEWYHSKRISSDMEGTYWWPEAVWNINQEKIYQFFKREEI